MHLFIQPVVHGHLGLLWFRAIPNSASMNILVRDFWRTCVSVSFGWIYIQEGKFWVIQEGLFIQKPFVPPPPHHLLQVKVLMAGVFLILAPCALELRGFTEGRGS